MALKLLQSYLKSGGQRVNIGLTGPNVFILGVTENQQDIDSAKRLTFAGRSPFQVGTCAR